jgi:branched-chain amino acid transport system permease protein
VIRPILGQPAFSIVMLTIGIGYVARGLITMIPGIGTETHTLPVPYKDMIWKMGGNAQGIGALVINVSNRWW